MDPLGKKTVPQPVTIAQRLHRLRWLLFNGVLALAGFAAAWFWAAGAPEPDPEQRWRSPIYITTAGEKGMLASFRVEVFNITIHKEVGPPRQIERAWAEQSDKWNTGLMLALALNGAALAAGLGMLGRAFYLAAKAKKSSRVE